MDGRLLYEEVFDDPSEFFQHVKESERINAKEKLKTLLKIAREKYQISKPRKYFAVLMMDGDEMGKWISGDKMPEYESVLHPNTKKELANRGEWKDILENKRLMTPAIHGFISKALGDFSLKLVRYIVEIRYPGKLVYAGGDDVFALLPLDYALEVARELRAAFSGEIFTGEIGTNQACTKFDVQFGKQRTGYICLEDGNNKRLFTTMGHLATASTGIAIAHYKQSLDITLNETRKAEKAAKSQEGRNAFSLTFLKRSGETMSAGAKWTYDNKNIDTVSVLLEFKDKFLCDAISSKFPYILRSLAESLSLSENEKMYMAEIKRLLARQQGSQKLDQDDEMKLAEDLAKLVMHANNEKRTQAKDEDKDKPQGKLKTFADLLIFTRFLANGEGEED